MLLRIIVKTLILNKIQYQNLRAQDFVENKTYQTGLFITNFKIST